MAFLGAKLGTHALDSIGVRHYLTIVDDFDVIMKGWAEIQFYSFTGEFIGGLTTQSESNGAFKYNLEIDKIGGLDSFEIEIAKEIDMPLFNQMIVKFFINGVHWYTGELTYKPDFDSNESEKLKFEGNGYYKYLKKKKVADELYQNKTIDFIVADLIENYFTDLPIIYNPDIIDLPTLTIVEYEIKNKDLSEIFEYLLQACNYDYNNTQYEMGVDKNRHFYFRPIDTEIQAGFFEGFQYQNPKVKFSTKDVVNKLNLQRTASGSDTVELVDVIEDTESQEKYGIQESDYTISDYLSDETALLVGQAIVEQKKNPIVSVEIKDLKCLENPYPMGFYNLNNKVNDYKIDITGCDNLSEWDLNITNTSVSISDVKVFSGKKSMFIETAIGSNGEYIEFELNNEINYPNILRLNVFQDILGKYLKIICYDIDGLSQEYEIDDKLSYQFIEININLTLDSLKKIRVEFITDDEVEIYLDSILCISRSWKQRTLCLQKIKYGFENGTILAEATFGNEIFNFVNEIKNLKNLLNNVKSIQRRY